MLTSPQDWIHHTEQCASLQFLVDQEPEIIFACSPDFCPIPFCIRFAGLSILGALYGPQSQFPLSRSKVMIDQIRELGEAFAKAAVPGAYLVELIPVMRYLPQWLASWKRQALQQHRYFSDMLLGLSEEVSSRMVSDAFMCSSLHITERLD